MAEKMKRPGGELASRPLDVYKRQVLTEGELEENKFLTEMEKYELLSAFWKLCEQQFGYTDVKPTLDKLLVTMFVTYTEKYMQADLPQSWKSYVSYKAGNVIAFLDNLMNSMLYKEKYDELSARAAVGLNVQSSLGNYLPEELLDCDTSVSYTHLDVYKRQVHW